MSQLPLIDAVPSGPRQSIFGQIRRIVAALARRIAASGTLSGYERIAQTYETWTNRATTPQAAAYWAKHAQAMREMINDLRSVRTSHTK